MENFTEPEAHLVIYSLIINIFPNHAQTVTRQQTNFGSHFKLCPNTNF